MTYQETINFLFSSLPVFQRQGGAAYKADLRNSLELDRWFNHPHRDFHSVHVAGTNGKGSVSHMLASVFQEAGYRTGLYTSPHLLDFRERIRINGEMIPESEVTRFVTSNKPVIRDLSPSFFEMTVAMAFDYFSRRNVDMAIVETGLGGRLDSTNIITPLLSVVTNISRDHMEFLGNDIATITREKGGIIKPGVPVVIGPTATEPEEILLSMARGKGSPAERAYTIYEPLLQTFAGDGTSLFRFRRRGDGTVITIPCGLSADYQKGNIATALVSVDLMRKAGWEIPDRAVRDGFERVVTNTGILGRWQTIGYNPRSICDTAHNHAGIEAVMEQVRQIPWKKLHLVWGMVKGKELSYILSLLPKVALCYFTRSSVPRSLDPAELQREASAFGLEGSLFATVEEAYRAAEQKAGRDDLIFTGGSTYVVADLLASLGFGRDHPD